MNRDVDKAARLAEQDLLYLLLTHLKVKDPEMRATEDKGLGRKIERP